MPMFDPEAFESYDIPVEYQLQSKKNIISP
jgi:hypothetical protein